MSNKLGLKVRTTNRKVGTASRHAYCDIIGRVKLPLKICIENIPSIITIKPYVMRNLAHPMNLGQCFLRKVQADMVFRLDHIVLKLKNGVTKLIDRQSTINAQSVDKWFQTVIDRHTN